MIVLWFKAVRLSWPGTELMPPAVEVQSPNH